MGYYRNGCLNLAWDLGVDFLGMPNWLIGEFLEVFFINLGLKGVMEK